MIVSFCFSIKLMSSLDRLTIYQSIISKSVECAKLHHKVKFYTDAETLKYLEHIDVEKIIIDTNGFYFLDDFKIHLLSVIDDEEVIVDTDLFLFAPLKLKDGYDIYVDFKDNCTKHYYPEHLKFFRDNNIDELIPAFNTPITYIPNIGILKIPNKKLKKEYIQSYYKIRDWTISKNNNLDRMASMILGQYMLGLILKDTKYKIYYSRLNSNYYLHLSGPQKFEIGIINSIDIKNKLL